MPKRTGKTVKRPDKGLDAVQNARRVVLESVGETETVSISASLASQVMAAMGRKGGRIGGKHRMEALNPEQRTNLARLAAVKRWGNRNPKK